MGARATRGTANESGARRKLDALNDCDLLGQLWEEILDRNGACWGKAVSHSMHPLIREGDRILVEHVPPGQIKFGEIVVFRRSGQLVIHRVLGRRISGGQVYFLEKGDGNLGAYPVPAEDVVGRVRRIDRATVSIDLESGLGQALRWTLALNSYIGWVAWRAVSTCVAHARLRPLNGRCDTFFRKATAIVSAVIWRATRMPLREDLPE